MKPELLLSVVICTRNRAEPLREALSHYQSLLASEPLELIIVDNGSTDDTQQVIQSLQGTGMRVRATFCAEPGLGRAREHGRRVATGDYLIFTDDDCYPDRGYLEAYRRVFAQYPDVDFFGGRILLWDESDARVTVDYRDAPVTYSPHYFPNPGEIQGANIAVRRDVLDAIGGFDANMGAGTPYPCEDIDLVARLLAHSFSGLFHPDPVIFHHHRRKDEHIPALRLSYAKGRGAYYMKFILEPKTRGMAARNWYWGLRSAAWDAMRLRKAALLREPWEEVKSAIRYLLGGTHALRPRPVAEASPIHLQLRQ